MKNRDVSNWIWLGFLSLFVIGWEFFNYATTRYPLISMFGVLGIEWVSEILSFTMVGTDILFFVRAIMLVRNQNGHNSNMGDLKGIGLALLLVTFGDAFLTWWFLAANMEKQIVLGEVPVPKVMMAHLDAIPIVVALLSWLLQATMISVVVYIIYSLLKSPPVNRQANKTKSNSYNKSKPQQKQTPKQYPPDVIADAKQYPSKIWNAARGLATQATGNPNPSKAQIRYFAEQMTNERTRNLP